jgi:Ca2+-binding RTX toxin-like protein
VSGNLSKDQTLVEDDMAKITYGSKLGLYGELSDFYNPNKIGLDSATATEIVYVDKQGGEKIIFEGQGLTVNNKGVVTGGTIDEIHFTMKFGLPLITATDIDASAKPIAATLLQKGVTGLLELALNGNDTVNGSTVGDYLLGGAGKDKMFGNGGEDHIRGGLGNDRMSGNAASDTFQFASGDGKDVITDFDAVGGARAQDYIDIGGSKYSISDAGGGNDTLIAFGDGDTITLLGVKSANIDASDFI